MLRVPLLACILLGSLLPLSPAAADHDQEGVRFDHKGGNEWWVQLQLGGRHDQWWTPEVRDENGDWKTMTRPSWAPNTGFYAVSYHVEPGHKVQFRLQYPKSTVYLVSCWFTHPAGAEVCDGSETFRATFHPSGDAETIRVRVDATQPIGTVYAASPPMGWSFDLPRLGDGSHGADRHVPDGTILAFWTTSLSSGEYAESACYRWPDVMRVECPTRWAASVYDPQPVDGDWSRMVARLSDAGVEPAKVEVRFDGGDYQPMTILPGERVGFTGAPTSGQHRVHFRVTAPDGTVACRTEGFQWPFSGSHAPFVGTVDGPLFTEQKGNEHYVQTMVYSPTPIVAVEAQVNQGAWVRLPQQAWCDFGRAMSAPAGSSVVFRAFFPDLSYATSAPMAWPPGTTPPPFEATFRVSGHADLIRVAVDATRPVGLVTFSVDMGGGAPLAKQADGAWTRVGHVPDGLVLRFTAHGPTPGERVVSGCYRWPAAVAVSCPDHYFAYVQNVHAQGDGSRIAAEAVSYDDPAPAKVQVRFDGGPFQDMTLSTDWPHWYRDGAPATGDHVAEFRLVAPDGQVACDEDGYYWPRPSGEAPMIGPDGRLLFAEAKGTTGWVQVNTYGADVVAVEAQVDGGPWQPLRLQPYCDWARAMSAPEGSQVRFRAFHGNLTFRVSEPIAWPPGSTPPNQTFDATFSHVKGNAWWIQASVGATGGTLAKVEASLDGGAWKPLTDRGWGWAASHHAPSGTIVRFRATSAAGAVDLSGCYRWTTATPVACPGDGTPPPGGGFDATFRNVKGNAWWIQADVTATGGTLAGVDARVNGGAWIPLVKQSWGSWAKSIHAPSGSTVELRARATDGGADVSAAYRWPPAA